MISPRVHTWISGTLELSSKVRYGMSSRGTPFFRFVPYDRRFPPMAVGCSQRSLFYNVHAIVEPREPGHGSLVQNLGVPTKESELAVLLAAYAYDSRKDLRPSKTVPDLPTTFTSNETRLSFSPDCTFAIDPPGCRDADDTVSFEHQDDGSWLVAIHIADVAAWIPKGHSLDVEAEQRATSFYSPEGQVLCPMFPPTFSEEKASLLPGQFKPTFSLLFRWTPGQAPTSFEWRETFTQPTISYTYEEAQAEVDKNPYLQALRDLSTDLGGSDDSHSWIASLMILYNTQAGILLKKHKQGLLRKHAAPAVEKLALFSKLAEFAPALLHFAQESAEFCLASEDDTVHVGLKEDAYAYASSPLRRYADLVNQRCLKQILYSNPPPISSASSLEILVESLNRRQKQAKALQRDLFFLTNLSNPSQTSVKGIVLQHDLLKQTISVYVEAWKRIIKVRSLVFEPPALGAPLLLNWFDDRSLARWKERIVFKASLSN